VEKVYCVYILTNQHNRVLYTGVTGDLRARVHQHRERLCVDLPAGTTSPSSSIMKPVTTPPAPSPREKQIKAGSRRRKIDLINRPNPEWRDLYEKL
jgi:putative endonuclease